MLEAQRNLPHLERVILVDPGEEAPGEQALPKGAAREETGEGAGAAGALPEGVLTLADVEASGRGEEIQREVERAAAQVGPEDVLTLIYTSGTTGPPKGVQLSHRNLMSAVPGSSAWCASSRGPG